MEAKILIKIKNKIYLLFILIALCIALWLCFHKEPQILNIKDTYYVIDSFVFSIFIIFFYSIFSASYFFTKKYSNYFFALINSIFITIPILYFILPTENEKLFELEYYLAHRSEFIWKEVYIPSILGVLFLMGIVMLFINIALSVFKHRKAKCLESR